MKTLLLTGFEPFLNFSENPTMNIVENLHGIEIAGYQVIGKNLPVDYEKSGNAMIELMDEVGPDAVVSLGLAGGRNQLTPERIAINCNESDQPDNAGNKPRGERIHTEGPDGIFRHYRFSKWSTACMKQGIPRKYPIQLELICVIMSCTERFITFNKINNKRQQGLFISRLHIN